MLRHTAFSIVSLLACSVASAQYPITPFGSYGSPRLNPAYAPTGAYSGIQRGGCVGGNCPTGSCPNGNCTAANCANGNCAGGQMICGPSGCFPAGSGYRYQPQWPVGNGWTPTNGNYRIQPYPMPGSTYPAYPNVPSAYRNRSLPTTGNYHLYSAPATGDYNYYPPATGSSVQYDAYSGPGVLH